MRAIAMNARARRLAARLHHQSRFIIARRQSCGAAASMLEVRLRWPKFPLFDDFVILSRGHAAEALAWTKAVMTKLGLTINEAKTSLKDARKERFDFLGYSFGPHWFKKNGKWYLGASPSEKSNAALQDQDRRNARARQRGALGRCA
jgi:hypothetical protein